MPTVIMEAMASGLAVIATDVGAVSQQVERNGWLLPGPEPVAVAQAMRAAMDLPSEDLLSMKRRSLEKVREQFTWKYVIGRKLELLKTVRLRVW
jgi:glycosyltransferase involved in cell wall biosynthesis